MCMCVKSLQSCPTLCNSIYYSPLGSCVHGILQARILKLPFPSLRNLPDPGIKHRYSALQVNSLYQGSPHYIIAFIIYKKKSWLILCTNLTEPQGAQIFGQKAIPVVSLKVFLDEISSWIGRLIFPLQSGEARIEQEDWLPSPHRLPWWLRWYTNYLQCRRPRFDPWVGKIP